MGAVGSKRSKNICITAVSGVAKNIPTMPHIMPQTMRRINTVAGCRFNEPPTSLGSIRLPVVFQMWTYEILYY